VRFREGANVKLVRILLPITQHGTTEACAAAAFSLAERSGAQLEVLHACPAPAERLPYSTELSPFYSSILARNASGSACRATSFDLTFTDAMTGAREHSGLAYPPGKGADLRITGWQPQAPGG
jgi:mevalonate pyrophosphate decarboxylase